MAPNPVVFKNGPIRTTDDGSFQTPDNLLVGSAYRLVVRAPGKETILSDWITIGDQPRVLLPIVTAPAAHGERALVDRQACRLLASRSSNPATGPSGRRPRPIPKADSHSEAFARARYSVFAHGDGFRFSGRLVKPGDVTSRWS